MELKQNIFGAQNFSFFEADIKLILTLKGVL